MNNDLNILIIDTDHSILDRLESKLNNAGFGFCQTVKPDVCINELESLNPDLALLGPSLDTDACPRCIHKLKIIDSSIPIITSHYNDLSQDGVIIGGPFEGIYNMGSDPNEDEIADLINRALAQKTEIRSIPDFPVLLGQSGGIQEIRKKIMNISNKDVTVLITGETGTGKELIARSLHYYSPRSTGPLIKINCGALPDELLESEVFGFQKGAFTGAHKDKPGRLEMANGGTLFVDEIGDLSLALQAKFLQVLEDDVFSRLGGTQDKIVDTRVVTATNSDLWKKVKEGSFRKDLLYRLDVVRINAPPLRKRKEDVSLLIDYFLNKYSHEFKKDPLDIPNDCEKQLQEYPWPGNVRELENVIRRAIVLRNWDFLEKELDNPALKEHDIDESSVDSPVASPEDEMVAGFFEEMDVSLNKIRKSYVSGIERDAILKTLKETGWNRTKAAGILKVSYKTLANRIAEYALKPEQ